MSTQYRHTVSIITPAFNSEAFIADTIDSVLAQAYQEWELIIVDDNSSDRTVDIVTQYLTKEPRIKLITQSTNSGAANTRNIAINSAQGRFIAFLDSDDLWAENKLNLQIKFMLETSCPFSYTAYTKINESGEIVGDVGVPLKVNYKDMLKTCYIGCLTAIYDTEYFGKITMPLIRKRQDYGLWLELLKKTEYACGINESLAFYRNRKDSISSSKIKAARYNWLLYREVENLSILQSLYYFSHYAARSILRYKFPKLSRKIGVLHDVENN